MKVFEFEKCRVSVCEDGLNTCEVYDLDGNYLTGIVTPRTASRAARMAAGYARQEGLI